MGLDALPSTALVESSSPAIGGFVGALIQQLIIAGAVNLAIIFGLMVMVAMVLYYFTGDKKKADEFMPHLMSQTYRLFGYIWLTFVAFGAFVGISQMLNFILTEILPEKETFRVVENDSVMFVKGLMLTLLMALFAALIVILNRRVVEITKIGSTISVKYFLGTGIVLFSFLLFVSSISFVNEFVGFLDETDMGLPAGNLTSVIVSSSFLGFYVVKSMNVLKMEKKK